jgi:hypothetical protein
LALEAATTGSQATQATVSAINSKVDTGTAALQARLDRMEACEAQRKFYAPNDAKKDANGCVGVGDYDLNMATGSNINLANGLVKGAQTGTSDWTAQFAGGSLGLLGTGVTYGSYGIATATGTGYGVTGISKGNGYGVRGLATDDAGGVGGYFAGGNSGVRAYGGPYGIIAQGTTAGVYSAGPLCINGSCISSWPTCNWGGWRWVYGDRTGSGGCYDDMAFYCDSAGHVTGFSAAC